MSDSHLRSSVGHLPHTAARGGAQQRVSTTAIEQAPSYCLESISIKGESNCQQRMLDVTGVMEVQRWGDEERFEAAVHTEEGPKSLKGTVVTRCSCIDIQSGAIPRWQVAFREADQAIRNAYDKLAPREAIRVISTIWEQLDRTSELAAARSRLLVGKLAKPRLAPLPDWFEDQRDKLSEADEGEVAANPSAVAIAELLVRAAVAAVPTMWS